MITFGLANLNLEVSRSFEQSLKNILQFSQAKRILVSSSVFDPPAPLGNVAERAHYAQAKAFFEASKERLVLVSEGPMQKLYEYIPSV